MPVFLYTAMDAKGQEQKGKKEAANEEEVQSFLKNQGLFPTSIKNADKSQEKKKGKAGKKEGGLNMNISLGPAVMKTKEITLFTRQMAILLDAGLPLIRSLKTLARQAKNPVVRKIIEETATAVEGGATFSEALAQHPASFDKLFLNDALHLLYLVLLLYVHNADAGSLLSGASCTSAAVGIAFCVVGHAIVDDMGQVVHVQSACRHIGGNEQLGAVFAELLHGEVALLLAQFAMQGIGVVSVAYQIIRHLLCLHSGAAEDDGVDAGIEVHNALQCQVFVFGVNHIIDVVYAFGSFVSASHLDGVRAVQVVFGNAFDFLAHGGAEKQCAALLGNALKDSVQVLLESHAEHFVRLVQDHMADVGKLCHATFH